MRTKFLQFAMMFGLSVPLVLTGGPQPAFAAHVDVNGNPLPHATYRIWDLNAAAPLFGYDANMTVSDPNGASLHVASAGAPFTNITVMENTFCSSRPCGVTYWNPATNAFKCYGYSDGAMTGVDVNISGPTLTAPDGTTYPQGSTWLFKSSFVAAGTGFVAGLPFPAGLDQCGSRCSLSVQFPGSNLFRSWEAGNVSSGAVDQTSGLIWVTDQNGFIGRFNPATNVLTRWTVGALPRDIVVDGSGRAYATVGPSGSAGDEIVRIDPAAAAGSQVTRWAVPAAYVGHPATSLQGFFGAFSENPNGIARDSAGRIWFGESISNEIGRLDPATNTFAEYRKVDPVTGANAINEPQNVAASGAGANLQAFFSEGSGNATGIVTPAEAAGTAQEVITVVAPTTPPISPETLSLPFVDHERAPSQKDITPMVHPVDGLDGVPWTAPGPMTATGEVIPGILRFPFPAGFFRAVGMTEVLIPNTVFGSLIGPAGSFPSPPTDEHVFELKSGAIIAEPEVGGRMTGGGSIPGSKVRHGFELHCNVSQPPNNLQVNFGKGNKFHLEVFTSASCSDDPTIDERPPVAGFDTFAGSGMGRYNGVSGATIEFKFTDAGEPGVNDFAKIKIVDAGGSTVLNIAGMLQNGNHQAHPANNGSAPLDASSLPATAWVLTESGYAGISPVLDSSDPGTEICAP